MTSTSIFNKLDAEHSLWVGGAGAAGSYFLYGNQNVPVFGTNIPSPLWSGGIIFAANYVTQIINDNYPLTKAVPLPKAFQEAESMAIVPAVTGLATYGVHRMVGGPNIDFAPNFFLGAGAELTGQYVMDKMEKSSTTGVV